MADERIGTYGNPPPKLTIGGNQNIGQCVARIGIGNNQYVVVSVNDSHVDIDAEIAKLKKDMKRKRSADDRIKKDSKKS